MGVRVSFDFVRQAMILEVSGYAIILRYIQNISIPVILVRRLLFLILRQVHTLPKRKSNHSIIVKAQLLETKRIQRPKFILVIKGFLWGVQHIIIKKLYSI